MFFYLSAKINYNYNYACFFTYIVYIFSHRKRKDFLTKSGLLESNLYISYDKRKVCRLTLPRPLGIFVCF